jgi:hypothetical protein
MEYIYIYIYIYINRQTDKVSYAGKQTDGKTDRQILQVMQADRQAGRQAGISAFQL